jgi:predicted nucleotidyltransferase
MNEKPTQREIIDRLKQFFTAKPEVALAYVYGSFLRREDWRDLDVAVLIERAAEGPEIDPFRRGLRLAAELEEFLGRPYREVDLRVLNGGNYSATKRHKRHKREKDGNEPDEASKIDSGSPPCCSRCAFCAFLWLCLSSYDLRGSEV